MADLLRRAYWRWTIRLAPVVNLFVLAFNATLAVLGLVWLWPVWWAVTATNALLLVFWWHSRTRYATRQIEIRLESAEEDTPC